MLSGPKTLSGGWLSVTRQYWGERRVSSIRFVLVAVPIAFFICPPPIGEPLNSNRRAKAKQLDESIGNTLVSRARNCWDRLLLRRRSRMPCKQAVNQQDLNCDQPTKGDAQQP